MRGLGMRRRFVAVGRGGVVLCHLRNPPAQCGRRMGCRFRCGGRRSGSVRCIRHHGGCSLRSCRRSRSCRHRGSLGGPLRSYS